MDYKTRLQAFEITYREIVETACQYYEQGKFKRAIATIAMASQMAVAFRLDNDIWKECFAMI